jgi:hypothetical protein
MSFVARCSLFFVVALAFGAVQGPAAVRAAPRSSGQALPEKLNELNDQAVADYQAGDFESAKLGLLEAIAIGAKSGLSRDFLMVRSYVNLAAVYVNGFKDVPRGKKALAVAVKIKSDLSLPAAVSTPELRDALTQVLLGAGLAKPPAPVAPVAVVAPPKKPAAPVESKPKEPPPEPAHGSAKSEGGPDEPDLPASIAQPLYCPNPDEAAPGEPVTLRCVTQPSLSVARVLLYYRPVGDEKFASVSTARSAKGWYTGVVPAEAASGKAIQYYFEARDATDTASGNSGRSDSPNVILLRGADGASASMSEERAASAKIEEEDPLKARAEFRRREQESVGRHRRGPGAFFVGVGGGSGYGWQPGGNRLEYYSDAHISGGALPSGIAQIVPEIGYQVSELLALSVLARFQMIPATGTDKRSGAPATGALSLLGRAAFLIGRGNVQGTFSLLAGGGEGFRLTVQPGGQIKRNDSVLGGPVDAGLGFGVLFHLSNHFALALDLRALAGFPTFALVGDGNAGVQVSF